MLLLAQQDGAVHRVLAEYLKAVEERFNAELLSDLPSVNALAEHVERYRGKMLRPTLVVVSAMAAFPERADEPEFRDAMITVATVTELVHMATLVHDDILDEAEMRRRGATINHLRGNEAAVMLGDYLISHAYHLCSALVTSAPSRAIAAATNTVCEGELLQLHHRNDWSLTERTYFEIIRRKTAALCGVCCRLPAVLATTDAEGAGSPLAEPLFAYGEKLGIAFQIIDDVLDLTGDPDEVGKSLGRDLAKGKLTLPLIHHLAQASDAQRAVLLGHLDNAADPDAIAALRSEIQAGPSLDYTRQWASRLVGDAKAAVTENLIDSPARRLLLEMADAVISRRF